MHIASKESKQDVHSLLHSTPAHISTAACSGRGFCAGLWEFEELGHRANINEDWQGSHGDLVPLLEGLGKDVYWQEANQPQDDVGAKETAPPPDSGSTTCTECRTGSRAIST